MKKIGIIGLGNMGIGLAQNLIKNGFEVTGFDLSDERLKMLRDLGGTAAPTVPELGKTVDAVFVMVLNGAQVKEVVLGENGLINTMAKGATVIVTATINPSEVIELDAPLREKGIELIDSPVSGGKSGADNGTLTLMASGQKSTFDTCKPIFEAVGKDIYHVGEEIGMGQKVKASLQALIGSSFTAIFESLVLGVKAGVPAETLYKVFSTSGVSSNLFKSCATLIMDREFKDTGSHIGTMYKDLGISMQMAKENGVAMFTTSAAYELFRSGMSLFPEEDNWSIVKLLEQIAGIEVKR